MLNRIRCQPVTHDDLADARAAGRRAAEQAVNEQAPTDPLLKVAWTAGHGSVDAVKEAVDEARAAGVTWREIGLALDENWRTVQSRFSQQDRWHKYRDRHKEQP